VSEKESSSPNKSKNNADVSGKWDVMSFQDVREIDLSFLKVLVAEDNMINQSVLAMMFEKMGLQYKIVSHGGEVLETLLNERYDLVLADCYMAPMNGFELARKIRASNESFCDIPLLAFTASSNCNDHQRCIEAGMNDVILKPITYEQLEQKMREWTQRIFESLPVLDESSIDKIRLFDDHEQSLVKSLLQIYSENTSEELRQMYCLIEENRMDEAKKKAHKLKSSAAQLGALRFEKYCDLMEYDPRLTQKRAEVLYQEMYSEYEKSRAKFKHYCQSLEQSSYVSV